MKNKTFFNCSVSNFYNKNQFVIRCNIKNENIVVFQSYKSEIAYYNQTKQTLFINEKYVGYSKTTSKHLYLFIRDYTRFNCYNLKDLHTLIKTKQVKVYYR